MTYIQDTIFALITSIDKKSSVAIIRMSGADALTILPKLGYKKPLEKCGVFFHKIKEKNKSIDETIISYFKGPNSYTGEDIVEINFHANSFIAKKIFSVLEKYNFRMATKGEFTKRAFLNGKINLIKAEAINKLIKADTKIKSEKYLEIIESNIVDSFVEIKKEIVDIIGNIEVNIDYPEYKDVKVLQKEEVTPMITKILKNIEENYLWVNTHIEETDKINIVILGKPNTGKSTLFNKLLKNNRVITSSIKGTTRDCIEQSLIINDKIAVNLVDTAGIRKTKSILEKKAIKKTQLWIKKADLIIYLITNDKMDGDDEKILETIIKKEKVLIFNNKADIKKSKHYDNISSLNGNINNVFIKINNFADKYNKGTEVSLFNYRHKTILKKIIKNLNLFLNETESISLDITNIYLYKIIELIDELIGNKTNITILDSIFNNFCLGK